MARKPRHDEEHMDESWLIPYADILTLLLALFIVLFASAEVNQKKVEELAKSFSNAFKGNTSIFESVRTTPHITEQTPRPMTYDSPAVFTGVTSPTASYVKESFQLMETKKQVDEYIGKNNLIGEYETILTDQGLLIRMKDSAVFNSGRAELLPEAQQFAKEVAKMLVPLEQKVHISGHTDNVPINTVEFPSNWDLSAKRALNFMKFIIASEISLRPERFNATGYGEYSPLIDNSTEENRRNNRRVEVFIIRNNRIIQ